MRQEKLLKCKNCWSNQYSIYKNDCSCWMCNEGDHYHPYITRYLKKKLENLNLRFLK